MLKVKSRDNSAFKHQLHLDTVENEQVSWNHPTDQALWPTIKRKQKLVVSAFKIRHVQHGSASTAAKTTLFLSERPKINAPQIRYPSNIVVKLDTVRTFTKPKLIINVGIMNIWVGSARRMCVIKTLKFPFWTKFNDSTPHVND
jgi:hypothetical protein